MDSGKEQTIVLTLLDSFIELLLTKPMTSYVLSVCFSTLLLKGMSDEDQFMYIGLLHFINDDIDDQNFEDSGDFFDWMDDKMRRFRQAMEGKG